MVLDLIQICLKMLSESLIRSVISLITTHGTIIATCKRILMAIFIVGQKSCLVVHRGQAVNLHINNNKQTLLEKTCKRILSYNFHLVIHLFIYCGWGEKKKRSCLAYSLLLLQTMIYCSKQKLTKMSFSILFYFAAYKGLDSCMFLSALLVGCCLLDFQHLQKSSCTNLQ